MTEDELRERMKVTAEEQAWVEWRERYVTNPLVGLQNVTVERTASGVLIRGWLMPENVSDDVRPDYVVG